MSLFDSLFGPKPYPAAAKDEVDALIAELVKIGIKEDFLSEVPGMGYNSQCRHIRTRQIGEKLNKIGGLSLMMWVLSRVRRKAGKVPASHLEYAWSDIGDWKA